VVCLDEKPVTLHADVRSSQPAKPGREARRDNEYKRCGTANVFCAVEPKAGKHFTFPTARRTAGQFAQAVRTVAEHYSEAQTIHLVMDNLNIHGRKSLIDFYGEQPGSALWNRFTVHYTPKHGKLAEPSGNRDRPVFPAMPRPAKNSGFTDAPQRESRVESPDQPRWRHNQLEVRPKSRTQKSLATQPTLSRGLRTSYIDTQISHTLRDSLLNATIQTLIITFSRLCLFA